MKAKTSVGSLIEKPITAEQLRRARQVFERVLAAERPARSEIMVRECEGDDVLRATVERLIAADEQEHLLLDNSLPRSGSLEPPALAPRARVGPYRVLRAIGAGGMGDVYLADVPDHAGESYALKILRWTSPSLLHRFQKEQMILRRLQHPNIARFIDAGVTEQDCPYFVMEYVEGEPIDRFADQRHLSTDGRIPLLRQICAAVRYLHQNLVVHRDLKPANILVTAHGAVKLVDFGIAKLIHPEANSSASTAPGLMTPDYASPEQIRGGTISTLTDVYALGVLFYELLSGARPFASSQAGIHETLRRICEDEPLKPSAAMAASESAGSDTRRRISGELDRIVLKALEKQPERRYASVEQLDDDLRRYQEGLPVLAQGDSSAYRVRKFVARHSGAVAAGCTILALLAGGIVTTAFEARIARYEAVQAEIHAREAERQRERAEAQKEIARQERDRAEHETAEARREKENAERRLSELQELATGAASAYDAARSRDLLPGPEVIAKLAQNSLLALQAERALAPAQLQLLDATAADVQSYELATDRSWHVPRGWFAQETRPKEYRVGLDRRVRHRGRSSLFLRSLTASPSGSVLAYQVVQAKRYAGKRMRLDAYLRAQKISMRGFLGVNLVAADGSTLRYEEVGVSGTSGWIQKVIVLDVPAACESIQFFVQLGGTGTLWADDIDLQTVPLSVALTRRTRPQNLDFRTR